MLDVAPDTPVHEAVRHDLSQVGPLPLGDELQHHVERRDPAGTGHSASIDHIELFDHLELGILLSKEFQCFPMDGDAVAVEQPSLGERKGAGIEPAQERAVARQTPEPAEQALADVLGGRIAGADDHRGEGDFRDASLGRQGHAVARRHGAAIDGEQVAAEQAATGVLIRDAQALERRDQRVERKLGQKQEPDLLRLPHTINRRRNGVLNHCDPPAGLQHDPRKRSN